MKKFWKLFRIFFLLIFILLVFLYVKEYKKSKTFISENQPPNNLVDIGGYRLYQKIDGKGSPPIVILTGAGSYIHEWSSVIEPLSKITAVIEYDRGGYGWSELPNTPRDGHAIVQELAILLQKSRIRGPYILIGHSLGGLYARLFAGLHPDLVAGLILVDSRHNHFSAELPELHQQGTRMASAVPVISFLSKFGILNLFEDQFLPRGLTHDEKELYKYIIGPKILKILPDEAKEVVNTEKMVSNTPFKRNLPLIIITHGKPDQWVHKYESKWQSLQKDLLTLSSRSELLTARKSGHNIMIEQPEIIIQAAATMYAKLRK